MIDINPRDAGAVARALCGWAASRFGAPTSIVGAPAPVGAGFDSYIHFVQLDSPALPPAWRAPLAVRLLPSADRIEQATREAAVQGWCAASGFPAPVVLAVLAPDELFGLPAQVMARAPGTTALDALKARPWRAGALLRQLADLQLRLHALSTAGWPGSDSPDALVSQRLALPRRVAAEVGDESLAGALRQAEALRPLATSGPRVVCHGDFHPLNVVVDGSSASVIDWTDAGLGPPEADVARTLLLFHVAALAAGSALERRVLAAVGPRLATRYRRAYDAGAAVDRERLRAWEALHALHGWSQVVGLHAGGLESKMSADANRVPLAVGDYLRSRFERAVGSPG